MLLAVRLLGLAAGVIMGWQLGMLLSLPRGAVDLSLIMLLMAAVGVFGFVLMPFLTYHPVLWARRQIDAAPVGELVAGVIGLVIGLVIAALLTLPLAQLPEPYGQHLPILMAALASYASVAILVTRQREITHFLRIKTGDSGPATLPGQRGLLLDTSAIIDGRILAVSHTGFLEGELLAPRFVLEEVQHIADSSEPLRRNRGRRGLEVLKQIQEESPMPFRVIEAELPGGQGVDAGLVRLAREYGHAIVTNDFNLNRVAEIQGVRALNLNELSNAIQPNVLPGEELLVRLVQEGKEAGQGVAYLDDGTMVVVDQGRSAVGSERRVVVTRVLQTMAGRMIFATLRENIATGGQ